MIVFLHNYSEKSINYGNMEKIDCLKIKFKSVTIEDISYHRIYVGDCGWAVE